MDITHNISKKIQKERDLPRVGGWASKESDQHSSRLARAAKIAVKTGRIKRFDPPDFESQFFLKYKVLSFKF